MSRADTDALARLLAARHDAPGAGQSPPSSPPPDLAGELAEAGAVLALLDRYGSRLPPPSDEAATVPGGKGTAAPARLGRYQIVRELGGGGGGVVFLAHDPELNRPVALKMPWPELLLTEGARRRFRQEARAAAGLRHSHVAEVYDVGEDGAVCFLVSAYCPGGSLADWLRARTGPVPPRLAAGLVARLARAVAYIHTNNVLHRDLKPGNVLLDEDGAPKITDFGLARLLEGDGQGTQTGRPLGTPQYMPPEQAEGRKDVGPAADVYGLGAILYELLTGQPPFQGATRADTLRRVICDEPIPPRRLRAEVPRDLETICLKCLEKAPDGRYASADDLAHDLACYLAGRPIRARSASAWERAVKWSRRRPTAAALLALLVATVLAAGAAAVLVNRHFQAARADGLIDALLETDTERVPAAVEGLGPYRSWAEPRLRRLAAEVPPDSREWLRAALALLPWDAGQVNALYERALTAAPAELKVIREALRPHAAAVGPRFARLLGDGQAPPPQRLRAAAALAGLDPEGAPWEAVRADVVAFLVREDALAVGGWADLLRPARSQLREPLLAVFRDHDRAELSHVAAAILAAHHADEPGFLIEILQESDPVQAGSLVSRLDGRDGRVVAALRAVIAARPPAAANVEEKNDLDRRQANAAAALIRLDPAGDYAPLLRLTADPGRRSYLIHRLGPAGVPVTWVADALGRERDPSVRRALALALGDYEAKSLAPTRRAALAARLGELYQSDPDPGMHSAAEWVLRRWQMADGIGGALGPGVGRCDEMLGWRVVAEGHTLIEVRRPGEFLMGSPPTEAGRRSHEGPLPRRPHPFAIAAKKVTREQYRRFFPAHKAAPPAGESPDCPVGYVTFHDTARYCNWLSELEGLSPCYRRVNPGPGAQMGPFPDFLARRGYRLPTEEEWEYACRAGTTTARYFGESDELLTHYAWFYLNAYDGPRSVGLLMPNDFGLFDSLGNVLEWCSDSRGAGAPGRPIWRGSPFGYGPENVRAAHRDSDVSGDGPNRACGFRVARTLGPAD